MGSWSRKENPASLAQMTNPYPPDIWEQVIKPGMRSTLRTLNKMPQPLPRPQYPQPERQRRRASSPQTRRAQADYKPIEIFVPEARPPPPRIPSAKVTSGKVSYGLPTTDKVFSGSGNQAKPPRISSAKAISGKAPSGSPTTEEVLFDEIIQAIETIMRDAKPGGKASHCRRPRRGGPNTSTPRRE